LLGPFEAQILGDGLRIIGAPWPIFPRRVYDIPNYRMPNPVRAADRLVSSRG
jgi:hypothetical protein